MLLNEQDNLLENVKFNKKGFDVVDFDKSISHSKMEKFIENFIMKLIKKYSKKKLTNFKLEKYHSFVDLKLHYKIILNNFQLYKSIQFSKLRRFMHFGKFVGKYRNKKRDIYFLNLERLVSKFFF